ncbi:hypothetical protein AQUCO_00100633v1 [Aquilegia coerulea]|uniref:Uncharacterized protein n=1 Tax=Aquilegia coerulea TaxID=218851 RepID=A0A2G5FB96_AQUCA|nr:hypothetical protein AQUCO_00100633v1 [Aquilegia coerulea]
MSSFSTWLCTSGTKRMLIKIVHPGGHVELHDRPLLAAEIMLRNPRCCVAYPNVFKQPWAIVPPDTMLRLGQKFYVVPIGTIRKLQKLSLKHSPSLNSPDVGSPCEQAHGDQDEKEATCCSFVNTNGKRTTCFACLLARINSKEEEVSSESSGNTSGSSETQELTKKRSRDSHVRKGAKGSPKRRSSFDSWQPSLASIVEE